jgi:NtrC-family two-component system sensor histidine kinase KinB
VTLSVEEPPAPIEIRADADRIAVVLANLLANAVRHTPPGGSVVARLRGTGDGARFEVQDTGEGIPPQYQDRIFDRFFQVPGAHRGGVGLGLYISREVVRAHGGEMGATSRVGEGSTFWFTLPASPPADV